MTLENIYYIGQTVAVLAILVSLFGVYYQVRQQTQTARADLYLNATTAAAITYRELRLNPDFAQLLRVSFKTWGALSKTQRVQVQSYYVELAIHLDAVLTMHEQKLIDESQVTPWVDNFLAALITPGGGEWWGESQHAFTPQVRDTINQRLSDPETWPPPWTEFSGYDADKDDMKAVIGEVPSVDPNDDTPLTESEEKE